MTAVAVAAAAALVVAGIELEPPVGDVPVPTAPARPSPATGADATEAFDPGAALGVLRDCSAGPAPCLRWRSGSAALAAAQPDALTIYTASAADPSVVVALNRSDGAVRWQTRLGSGVARLGPAAAGALVVETVDGALVGLSPDDGHLRWRLDDVRVAAVMLTGPWIRLTEPTGVRALSTSDGHDIWRWEAQQDDQVLEVIDGPGGIPLVLGDDQITALASITGAERWSSSVQGMIDVSPIPGGEIVAIDDSGALQWFGLESGDPVRGSRLAFNAASAVELVLAGDDLVAIIDPPANDEGITTTRVVGLDAASGRVRWVHLYRSALHRSAVVGLPGRVILVGTDEPGTVTALDTETGQIAWQRAIASGPLTVAHGPEQLLFVDGSSLSALDPSDGAMQAQVIVPVPVRGFVTTDSDTAVLETAVGVFAVSLPPAG